MCPSKYYQIMKISLDKKVHRYEMVVYARKHGNKPAARVYNTSARVVRKWRTRYDEEGYAGLEDRSRRPHRSPNETPKAEQKELVRLRKKYKRLGADQVKKIEGLNRSARTIRKVWAKYNVRRKRRRKKHKTKQNLRAVKKEYKLYQQSCEDTKDLCDIPEYWGQMKKHKLPEVQYTHREVSCGIQFLGFSRERSLINSAIFAEYINRHLARYKIIPKDSTRQTDNGNEYIGAWNAKAPSIYTRVIERGLQKHRTIFPGAHTQQSDVETVHNLIEQEFYELEKFKSCSEFMAKVNSYQLFFNFERPNMYKEGKTPWELVQEKNPNIPREALMLPAINLDEIVKNLGSGGNNLFTNPSFYIFSRYTDKTFITLKGTITSIISTRNSTS